MAKSYKLDLNDLLEQVNRMDDRSNISNAETAQMLILLAIAERLEEVADAFQGGYLQCSHFEP